MRFLGTLLNGDSAVYLTCTAKLPFGGVRYTREATAKQLKAITALKGTILKKLTFDALFYHMA